MDTKIEFQDLKFKKSGNEIIGEFLNTYYFKIPESELKEIAEFKLEDGAILFDCPEKKARQKLNMVIDKGLQNLYNRVRNKKTLYIHSGSGIPLLGANEFGLVDRGTNIIEVKPSTGCNLSCVFCSVNEGKNDFMDIVIQEEYIIEEFKKLAAIKKHPVEASINPHGEPLLYPRILELIRDLRAIKNVDVISINTNGCLLNKKLIDELAAAGLTRINLSIHSLNKEKASKMADAPYNVSQVLEMIKYCEGKIDVLLAPVLVPGMNEDDIDDIIELSKTIKNKKYPTIGIQNFLSYKEGRNAAKEMPWENFFELLKHKEKEHNVRLIIEENLFNIQYDETLPKPFKKGQIIKAQVMAPGRSKNEIITVAGERNITVFNPRKTSGTITIKLIRDKHNIYTGVPV
ncbi:MAG: radical SAM protein [Candidatus Nanoarchaeia archaeon]